MEEIVTIISNIGFPAALCVIMLRYMIAQRDAHKAESNAYRQAIDANTTAIAALTTWLQAKEDKHND
nr:MAG TPA: YvrJ protein family protein [Caudoviricetes sp.]